MKKILFLIFYIISFSIVQAQKKPVKTVMPLLALKIVPSQTEVTLYTHVNMEAWLYNKGRKPISIFRQDFTAPGWYGVIESWYCTFNQKKGKISRIIGEPSSGFNENNIIDLYPGDSLLVDTLGYTFYEPGSYTFNYNIIANRKRVKKYYAWTQLAKKRVASLTEFNITTPITIVCKPVIFPPEKIKELSLEEVNQNKKQFNNLEEVFINPEEVYILSYKGQLIKRDLESINKLKNIHSLRLSNINYVKDSIDDAFIFDLPNLKELNIDSAEIEFKDKLLIKYNKLEKISLKNITYHYPNFNKAFKNLSIIKSIELSNCRINHITADFNKLQNLIRLTLNKNELKEIPPINNLPKLEYIDIQENGLKSFPDVFTNPVLKSLNLARNKIAKVPEDIGKLKTLISLDLSWNNISEIPPQIGKLEALTEIKLTGNNLSHLTDKFKNLSNLKILCLDENKFSIIDPILFKISGLEQLVINKNNISILPDKFSKLEQLCQLDISDNKISQLPKSLLKLEKLNVLKVNGNPIGDNKISHSLQKKLQSGFFY